MKTIILTCLFLMSNEYILAPQEIVEARDVSEIEQLIHDIESDVIRGGRILLRMLNLKGPLLESDLPLLQELEDAMYRSFDRSVAESKVRITEEGYVDLY